MKNIITIFATFILALNVNAQSLFQQLGGAETRFTIVSDTVNLDIKSQGIINRDVTERDDLRVNLSKLESGFTYSVNHLEFITSSNLIYSYELSQSAAKEYYKLSLYDDKDNMLYSYNLGAKWVKVISSDNGLTTYSFELYKIPPILLNQTKKFSIKKIRTTTVRRNLNKIPK